MENRICLLMCRPERELLLMKIIKKEILMQNPTSEVLITRINNVEEIARLLPTVMLTFPVFSTYHIELLSAYKKMYNCSVVSYITEGVFDFDNQETIEQSVGFYWYDPNLVDYYCYWGPKLAEKMATALINAGRIDEVKRVKTVGYPIYELDKTKPWIKKPEVTDVLKEKSANYKRVYLFATGFPDADWTKEEIISAESWIDNTKRGTLKYENELNKILNQVQASKIFRTKYIEIIKKFSASNPEYLVIVKMHPVECAEKKSKLYYYSEFKEIQNVVLLDSSLPISAVLSCTDVLVHYGSTSALEAYLYQIPTILIRKDEWRLFDSTLALDINQEDLVEQIAKKNIIFKSIESTDAFLYAAMNYLKEKPYTPAEDFAKFLISELEIRELDSDNLKKVLNNHIYHIRKKNYLYCLKLLRNRQWKKFRSTWKCLVKICPFYVFQIAVDFCVLLKRKLLSEFGVG